MSAAAYFQQNPDVAAAYSQNNYGLTPEQFAQTHYELYGQQEQRAAPAVVEQITSGSLAELPAYFQQNPDVAVSYTQNTYGLTPEQFAAEHYARYGVEEQRVSPTGAPAVIAPRTTTTPTTITAGTNILYFQQNPDVAAEYARNNLGMTPEQFAQAHYERFGRNEQRADPNILPFANATQGFADNFNNYTSIPIGAQYNPAAVGGTGSPYSQIMRQMTPVGNPYATVQGGLPMGGYDPNIYDPNLLSDFVAKRAADAAAATAAAATAANAATNQSGGDSGSGFYGGDLNTNNAPVESMGTDTGGGGFTNADPGGMFGGAQSGDVGFYQGGLINRVAGADPAGPDEGQINAQKGEYVVKKSSVKKYGKGLLDMINDGKIPAKKIKSLLD